MGYSELMHQLETEYRTSGGVFSDLLGTIFEVAPSAVAMYMQYGDQLDFLS